MFKIKKTFSCIIFIIIFLLINSINVNALSDYSFVYEIIDDEAIITRCYSIFDKIPDTIDGYPITKIGEKSFASANYDTNLLIPDTVREIGDYAFACEIGDGIWDITVPKSVTEIGKFAIGYYINSIDSHLTSLSKYEDMIIRGYKGTAAETYAKQNRFEFVYLDDEPEVTTATTSTSQTTTTSTTVSTTATSKTTTETTKATTSTNLTTTTSATMVTTNSTTTSLTTTSVSDSTSASSTSGSTTLTTTSTSKDTTTDLTTPLTTTSTSEITPITTTHVKGDANGDNKLDIRDAACIAKKLAQDKAKELPKWADFNDDGTVNVRDAAAIARYLASNVKK